MKKPAFLKYFQRHPKQEPGASWTRLPTREERTEERMQVHRADSAPRLHQSTEIEQQRLQTADQVKELGQQLKEVNSKQGSRRDPDLEF